jgi:fibronectin type 3 domain-containing protein
MTPEEERMNMNKRLKVWLSTLAVTLLLASLMGCSGTTDTPPQPPAKPTAAATVAGNTQASVSWSAVTGATSYNIYYGTAAGVTTGGTKVVNATSPYVITGLTNSTTYYFVVTAVNADGESGVSDEVTATPLPPAPAKPSGIIVSGGDTQAIVSWTAVSGATSYNIYYGTAANVTTSTGIKISDVTTPKTVTDLTNGTPYFFVVTAVNAGGESSVSSEKTATPAAAPQPPASPTGRVVTSTAAGQLSVTWNVVPGATSYNIYYLQANPAPTKAAVLASTPGTSASASFNITGLASGTYYVLVTAVNAAGESGTQTNAQAITIL